MQKLSLIWLMGMMIAPLAAQAHGIAGDRFFPATLAIDDPAVADELTMPQIGTSKQRQDDGSAPWVTDNEFEISKRLTQDFGLSFGGDYMHMQGINGTKHTNGFDNFELSGKYQLLNNAPHETIISAGVDWDMGGTGSKQAGAESFSTITPQLFFGKGFGDLPDSADYLKPFAVTGVVGVSLPDDRSIDGTGNPDSFNYGFTLQYSLPYLQQHVKDIGLTAPWDHVIPLVEFSFTKPIDRADDDSTTGTINPGFIWAGQTSQVGIEAILPINHASGSGIGAMAQLHFYLDDIFPTTLGKPLFGN
jgi:hypothetical protein